ncbi:50S ribosomal protein L22 [Candidatus Kaiserbacteria bacterium]|nr:50S ribosomal protein L22 [Candidatus Kaiserbacteria bacterium]
MKALLTNFHQSPQKVRLVADMIRGKSVPVARAALTFMPKKSSPAVLKLLNSAVANASSTNTDVEELFVKTITVNKGAVLKRFAPRARGRAAKFSRTMSIVFLELGTKAPKVVKGKAVKKVAAKRAKKAVTKAE